MKKIAAIILMLMLVCAVFASCDKDNTPSEQTTVPNDETTTATSEPTTPPEDTTTSDIITTEHAHIEEVISAIAPTCTEKGKTEGKKCSDCGEILVAQTDVPAAHKYESNKCTVCGKPKPTDGLRYELRGIDKYEVVGIGTATDSDIIIPDIYNGKPVTSIGNGAFVACSNLTSITIPDSVTTIGITTFAECSNLTSVTFGKSSQLRNIDEDAFRGCSSLTSINIPNSVTSISIGMFYGCSSLTSVNIPNSVTSIGNYAFYDCRGLTSVNIPNSVTSIGEYAFDDCSGLTSITVDEGNTVYASQGGVLYNKAKTNIVFVPKAISGNVIIPNSIATIDSSAFYECSSLTMITIPNSVTSIGNSATFNYCNSLTSITVDESNSAYASQDGILYDKAKTSILCVPKAISGNVTIPSSITTINSSAFHDCSSLTSIAIPVSVTTIGRGAFDGCSSLTSITIPNSVISIDGLAFANCSSLTSITIPKSVTSISNTAFRGCSSLSSITVDSGNIIYHSAGNCLIQTSTQTLIVGCKNSIIPDDGSVTSIGGGAFDGCSNLTSINIPDSIISIGTLAFRNCSSLTSIHIPRLVFIIKSHAFEGCGNLTSITVEAGNQDFHSSGNCLIDNYSQTLIRGCSNSIIPNDGSVRNIGSDAFSGCSSLTSITIPNSVTSIGGDAFSGCSNLRFLIFEENSQLISIGSNAFYNCSSLTSITIPDSVTSIGLDAFYGCSSLTSITIPNSVTSISSGTFFGCTNLLQQENGVYYVDKWVVDCDSSVTITLRTTTVGIGDSAFEYSNLKSISIPNSITSIGRYAFYRCDSLTSITIGSEIASIGDYAFSYSSLKSITFNGTKAEWESIEKGLYWDSNTGNYTIHCTDGDIPKA